MVSNCENNSVASEDKVKKSAPKTNRPSMFDIVLMDLEKTARRLSNTVEKSRSKRNFQKIWQHYY